MSKLLFKPPNSINRQRWPFKEGILYVPFQIIFKNKKSCLIFSKICTEGSEFLCIVSPFVFVNLKQWDNLKKYVQWVFTNFFCEGCWKFHIVCTTVLKRLKLIIIPINERYLVWLFIQSYYHLNKNIGFSGFILIL